MYVFNQFVISSDTMQGKCRTLRIKVILFQIMGPCNLIGAYQGLGQTYCLHLTMACGDRPGMLLQKKGICTRLNGDLIQIMNRV